MPGGCVAPGAPAAHDVDAFLAFLKRNPADYPAMHDFVKDLDAFERNWRERGVFFFPHVSGSRGDWPALNRILASTGYDAAAGDPSNEGAIDGLPGRYERRDEEDGAAGLDMTRAPLGASNG